MNFALLGGESTLLPLLRAVHANAGHRLSIAAELADPFRESLPSVTPGVRLVESWQEILNADDVDAVIAAPGTEPIDAGIKQLAAAGKPILLVPHGDPTSALAYELSLVHDDNNVPLVPLFPLRSHAQIAALQRGDDATAISVQLDRHIPVAGSPPLLTAADVYAALIYDADLLRQCGGNYSQVTAVFSGASRDQIALATVTLAGDGLPTATWTLRPSAEEHRFELSITRADGTRSLAGQFAPGEIPEGEAAALTADGFPEPPPSPTADMAEAILESFENSIGDSSADGGWTNLIRSVEIVEAASRSIRRRRTIDLHFETTSERNQFKTQMTAIGCSLMVMTLVAFIFVLMAGALLELNKTVMRILRIGIFVPLVLFLLLQVLLFIARPSRSAEGDDGDASERQSSGG